MVSTLKFAMWPQRIFGMSSSNSNGKVADSAAVVAEIEGRTAAEGWFQQASVPEPRQFDAMEEDDGSRKRVREEDGSGSDYGSCSSGNNGTRTPSLVSLRRRLQVGVNEHQVDHDERPIKRFRGESSIVVAVSAPKEIPKEKEEEEIRRSEKLGLLGVLPEDAVSHCLSFLNSTEDRFALQSTCKQFRQISNSDKMLEKIQVGGDRETGKGGIIQEDDTPESAAVALAPFARAGNLEAIYM